MRRFLALVFMMCLAVPAGISISGCTRNPAGNYCYGLGYGLKNTDVAQITLQPQTTGISLAYGQTQQMQLPTAVSCNGDAVSVPSSAYAYGTTNNKLVDISPTGNLCAGTWNRNTGGGIADYTYCNAPNPAPSTNGLPYGVAYVTASADSATSNPVAVYVHAQVSSISLVGPQQCTSQTQTANLDSQACYASGGQQYLLCKPTSVTDPAQFACPVASGVSASTIPVCSSAIGFLSFSVSNETIATINSATNVITADKPGTTAINASVAGSGASAGYFTTCAPQSISLTLANGTTKGVITQGVKQNLVTSALDTNGLPLTSLVLDYQSTNPIDITASGSSVNAAFPGVASVYAVCQPPTCNTSPINELGFNQTGLSVTSNAVNITTPGTISDYVWFAAPGLSQYFVPIELLTGTVGSAVRLPYIPNSMMMDKGGTNLYFGSERELMVYSTLSNTLTKQDEGVPGVVLAVSPDNTHILINDQIRQIFYIYSTTGGAITFPGVGNAASWSPDSKTLYITDNASINNASVTGHTDTLYVYNGNTGWSKYALPPSPLPPAAIPPATLDGLPLPSNVAISPTIQTPALTVPGIGAYLRGSQTDAYTWCPSGIVGNTSAMSLYSIGDSVPVQSDVLAATTDGGHILGASLPGNTTGPISLSDIAVTIPITPCPFTSTGTGSAQVQTLSPLTIPHPTPYTQSTLNVNAVAINQIVASPVSNLAFVTYTGNGTANAPLPYYIPGTNGAQGSVGYVALKGAAAITAPVAGAFTPDDSMFFVSTAGDNMIHYISIPANPAATAPNDTQQISPNLPACTPLGAGGLDPGCTYTGTGAIVPATAILVIPRSTT